jgi:hypothetical protein
MLAVTCPITGTKKLIGLRSIIRIENGPEGPVALFRCHCGSLDRWPRDRALPDGLPLGHATPSVPAV